MKKLLSILMLGSILSGCTMIPAYTRGPLPVAQTFPNAPATTGAAQTAWRDLFLDPQLQSTISLALQQNRDLRIAALNIQKAQAEYGISRAALFPDISAGLDGTKSKGTDTTGGTSTGATPHYTADIAMSAYEVDLFGRIRSLNKAALETFFAAKENRNAVEIMLIGNVANAWLTLAADEDTLKLNQQTFAADTDTYNIAQGQANLGAASGLDLAEAEVQADTARALVAAAQTKIDQDKAALTLLVGAPVDDSLLPTGLKPGLVATDLPVGLPSDVLLNRPDVLSSEHDLLSANADIGAARAAFFPSITLTASTGLASDSLNSLFSSGTHTYSYGAGISVPIFAGFANVNGLKEANASRDIALATYEKSIQQAFSDVSDALAVRARIDERLDAQTAATNAAVTSENLSQARYTSGADSYLTLLDAQRTLYTSQETLITLQALKATNLVNLYQAVGNDQSLN